MTEQNNSEDWKERAERLPEGTCCPDNKEGCSNEQAKKFINSLFDLVLKNRNEANEILSDYMESVETDRDFQTMKRKQAESEVRELREALTYARRFLNPIDHDTAYVDTALRSPAEKEKP